VFGLRFRSPLGLAAGLDKNAEALAAWATLGFGFVEVGTVTPRPQAGNPKPRLFRLPTDNALVNRMGFNNGGLKPMANHLAEFKAGRIPSGFRVGVNIGKNKDTSNDAAHEDYLQCLLGLHPWADYFVVNVSSPNTPGLRQLQDREPLLKLLSLLQDANQSQPNPKPLLLKIAPDLSDVQLDDVVSVALSAHLSGLVATNTTISRDGLSTSAAQVEAIGAGGLSGAPLGHRSREVVAYLHQAAPQVPIVGVGGIMSGSDALAMRAAGATLLQTYSGFVYRGPSLLREIYQHLVTKR
jgi:dihydroorotate dehydrogenase